MLIQIIEDKLARFRCHTGHGFTADALMETLTQSTGELIWQAVRSLQETEMLLEHLARHFQQAGESAQAKMFLLKAQKIGRESNEFHDLAIRNEHFNEMRLVEDANQADQEENRS